MSERIWVIDDDDAIRFIIEDSLQDWGYKTRAFSNALEALDAIAQSHSAPALIISDIRMPGLSGLELLEHAHRRFPDLPFIITTAYSDLDITVNAYQQGAFDYLPKPFDLEELKRLSKQALRPSTKQPVPQRQEPQALSRDIIGNSPAMQQLYRAIGRLAKTTVNVLISGETGTGKELIARALHKHSPVANGPFVALNMAAIPPELAEAELFGHEKGAFTGATSTRQGRFAQAEGGTLFLDEIGDMPLPLQAKLLRALAEGNYYSIGGQTLKTANVRIIAASHKNLSEQADAGAFRADLYHRLNVIHLHLPPLRERSEDIPALLEFHLDRAAKAHNMTRKQLDRSALSALQHYSWPGNIRELENLCHQLTILSATETINVADFQLGEHTTSTGQSDPDTTDWRTALVHVVRETLRDHPGNTYQTLLKQFDDTLIHTTLQHTDHHISHAASLLGIGRNTLTRKRKDASQQS
ncbi:nitrogen regulation protein NR(I) [Suttonella sp. R2A3]|uniref:nitrogen regulation protein NR(I) n=1 Tax=Suttonella sp. R2A3 TaxID=2908648 RepID=UPI001F32A6D0|nr:nitrogen regulation protein NR(I) [Suttonella sp. R2A3]UJF24448.1 nitrogen regulation protein NR(I) [Suttonella sp. R2A3]